MAVVAEAFVEHFDKNFAEIRDEMYNQYPKQYQSFMRVQVTPKAFIRSTSISGLGMPIPNRDLELLPFQEPVKGPISTFVPINYRNGYQIERQTIEQEEWGLLASRPKTMLDGANVLLDITAANVLNNGFTIQNYDYTVSGDTPKPLFAVDHLREDRAVRWSNLINQNLPITVETLFNAIVTMLYNMTDSRGLPIAMMGGINLFVPTINAELWQQAIETLKSVNNPNNSDNKVNALIQQFNINLVPLRFLTNPNHWFIAWDVNTANYGLKMVVNIYPEISPLAAFGNNPDAWFSRLRMRFTCGYENKRGVAAVGA